MLKVLARRLYSNNITDVLQEVLLHNIMLLAYFASGKMLQHTYNKSFDTWVPGQHMSSVTYYKLYKLSPGIKCVNFTTLLSEIYLCKYFLVLMITQRMQQKIFYPAIYIYFHYRSSSRNSAPLIIQHCLTKVENTMFMLS